TIHNGPRSGQGRAPRGGGNCYPRGARRPSEPAALGERNVAAAAHDAVDEQPYLDEPEGLRELQRDAADGLARLGAPGRMVVADDDGRGIQRQRALDDLARVHRGAVDRAAKELLVADDAVARVEKKTAEHLVRQIREPRLEEPGRVAGRREGVAPVGRRL